MASSLAIPLLISIRYLIQAIVLQRKKDVARSTILVILEKTERGIEEGELLRVLVGHDVILPSETALEILRQLKTEGLVVTDEKYGGLMGPYLMYRLPPNTHHTSPSSTNK